jgi:pimeloyl-ACP methyl ester carboxylesterase
MMFEVLWPILWSSAAARRAGLAMYGGWLFFCYIRFNTRTYLRSCRFPALVPHSERDRVTPLSHGRAICAAAALPRQSLKLASHHSCNKWQATTELRGLLAGPFVGEVTTWE